MLEAISSKIMAGVISLSMFLFSSYTGNEPEFRNLNGRVARNYLILRTALDNAFENDFNEVFKSGTEISIWFKVSINKPSQQLYTVTHRHTVKYDALKKIWNVYLSETNQATIVQSLPELLNTISLFECSIPVQSSWGNVEVNIESWLPEVYFKQIKKKVDLMVLWKLKRPKIKSNFDLRYIQ